MNKLMKTALKFGKKKATKSDQAKKIAIWSAKMAGSIALWVGIEQAAKRGLDKAFDRTVEDRTDSLEDKTNELVEATNMLHNRLHKLEKTQAVEEVYTADFAN